jgi:hypothetical protein
MESALPPQPVAVSAIGLEYQTNVLSWQLALVVFCGSVQGLEAVPKVLSVVVRMYVCMYVSRDTETLYYVYEPTFP